jgi:solute carrier family 25 carnitine/acylcarnitine transporter 20/29
MAGLYRGFSLPLLGTIAETATLFCTNGYLKRLLLTNGDLPPGAELPMRYVLAAGAGTGLAVSFVLTPIELVKCRMQVQGLGSFGFRRYAGPLDCLVRSTREEGLRVLYRGHVATMLRETPGTACWFGAYESFLRFMIPVGGRREDLSALTIVTAGALGGVMYWAAMYPSDTVKSVMQTDPGDYKGGAAGGAVGKSAQQPTFMSTLRGIYSKTGLRGLYAGVTPTMVRAVPSNAVIFLVYEYASRLMDERWAPGGRAGGAAME